MISLPHTKEVLKLTNLTAISSVDGRYSYLTNDLRAIFSEYGLIKRRVYVELQQLNKLICSETIEKISHKNNLNKNLQNMMNSFSMSDAERVKEIEKTTNHDVKAVEYFLKEKLLRDSQLSKYIEFIHFACTSEDINNISYALMLKDLREHILIPIFSQLEYRLEQFAHKFSDMAMLSLTHGQNASPTTLGKEFANFAYRIRRLKNKFSEVEIMAKINGAVGNFNAHVVSYPEVNWQNFTKEFIETDLGLVHNPYTTQIEPHDTVAEYFSVLTNMNTILLDFSRDIQGYISRGYLIQKPVDGEIGSSTMPHKINPIDFENAEGNLGLANALMIHLSTKLPISRFQRDLSDSTVLRALGLGISHSYIAYKSLFKGMIKIDVDAVNIESELQEKWELLAEPIQTVMRRYGIEEAYEKLKGLTRGRKVNRETMHKFIEQLELPECAKKSLLELTPSSYIGLADELARKI